NDALKEGGRGESAIGVRTRRVLIACEVALSLVLLMGAGVMIQSLLALRHGDSGFDPNNVLTMRLRLADARHPTPARRAAFLQGGFPRIRGLARGGATPLPRRCGSWLLVSRDVEKLYWGPDDPIGRRVTLPLLSRTLLREVV